MAEIMLVVQKYGGTSVGSIERIKEVAKRVAATRAAGHQVAVVVSAMSGETNRLLGLARQIAAQRTTFGMLIIGRVLRSVATLFTFTESLVMVVNLTASCG